MVRQTVIFLNLYNLISICIIIMVFDVDRCSVSPMFDACIQWLFIGILYSIRILNFESVTDSVN